VSWLILPRSWVLRLNENTKKQRRLKVIHARKDYNKIQDMRTEGAIPESEPVFLLRAKDICSPDIVMAWADRAEQFGASPEIIKMAREHALIMLTWGEDNGRHIPDLPKIN